jgi:hypothetical protein
MVLKLRATTMLIWIINHVLVRRAGLHSGNALDSYLEVLGSSNGWNTGYPKDINGFRQTLQANAAI